MEKQSGCCLITVSLIDNKPFSALTKAESKFKYVHTD